MSGLVIADDAVVCRGATLKGNVTIGSGTIVHPSAKIIAEDGPIIIGSNCIIEEQVLIANRTPVSDENDSEVMTSSAPVQKIGNNNVFEVDAQILALSVGDYNVVESKGSLGRDTTLGSHSCIGALCKLSAPEVLPDHTIVHSGNVRRVAADYQQPAAYAAQREHLKESLLKFHPLQKSD